MCFLSVPFPLPSFNTCMNVINCDAHMAGGTQLRFDEHSVVDDYLFRSESSQDRS